MRERERKRVNETMVMSAFHGFTDKLPGLSHSWMHTLAVFIRKRPMVRHVRTWHEFFTTSNRNLQLVQ